MERPPRKTFMRSFGEFVGHIVHGVRTDPAKDTGARREVRREVEQEERRTTDGRKVTLRRTTIEEVEIEGDEPDAPDR